MADERRVVDPNVMTVSPAWELSDSDGRELLLRVLPDGTGVELLVLDEFEGPPERRYRQERPIARFDTRRWADVQQLIPTINPSPPRAVRLNPRATVEDDVLEE